VKKNNKKTEERKMSNAEKNEEQRKKWKDTKIHKHNGKSVFFGTA